MLGKIMGAASSDNVGSLSRQNGIWVLKSVIYDETLKLHQKVGTFDTLEKNPCFFRVFKPKRNPKVFIRKRYFNSI